MASHPSRLVRNLTRKIVIATSVEITDTSARRRAGLLKREFLMSDEGLWIALAYRCICEIVPRCRPCS